MTTPTILPVDRRAYSIADVAKMGIFRKSRLYELVQSGELPARMAGGRMVILAADIDAFIAKLPPVTPKKRRVA